MPSKEWCALKGIFERKCLNHQSFTVDFCLRRLYESTLSQCSGNVRRPGPRAACARVVGTGDFVDRPGNRPAVEVAMAIKTSALTVRLMVGSVVWFGLSIEASANRTIYGTVVDSNGRPVQGYRVRALDSDTVGNDEEMAETTTDASGNYYMTYRKRTWDGPKVGTAWRPDIYIVVAKPKPGGGWTRVDQSGIRSDWAVRNDIRHDFTLPNDGECPFPAKFDTTGVWRGCNCPSGSYKRWLDAINFEARCAQGQSPEDRCKTRAGHWKGFNNTKGVCVEAPDIPSVHRWLQREAYRKYMRDVAKDVDLEPLPAWLIKQYQRHFTYVNLRNVRIGESDSTPSDSTAIVDCQKVYFPQASGELPKIRSQATDLSYHWLLHELAHTNQCMSLEPGSVSFSTKRDKYGDMWFANLPEPVLLSILTDGVPVDDSVHDRMPMEADADRQATAIIRATGIGTIPTPAACPTGEFSTRDNRGCACPRGTKKDYKGLFAEKAECK
jgi:hypothetical protein